MTQAPKGTIIESKKWKSSLLIQVSSLVKKHEIGMLKGNYDTPPLYEEGEQTRESLQEIATPLSSLPPSTYEVPTTSSSFESSSEKDTLS